MKQTKHYSNDDLFICDSDEPMCLAGIMGGSHHSVSDETTSILLESAYFDPVGIRKSSKNLEYHQTHHTGLKEGLISI